MGTTSLSPAHNRQNFSCGNELLDRYFQVLVTQHVTRRFSNCFLAVSEAGAVAAFYTFAATSLPLIDLPAEESR